MIISEVLDNTFKLVASEYRSSSNPWVIGYSGGKDSSLVVKIVYTVLSRLRRCQVPVNIVYCDTGVEIPIIASFVREAMTSLEKEAHTRGIPIHCHVATPLVKDRFFVRVIGRGYAPPTNKFRWCTDKLRIKPVQQLVENLSVRDSVVVLGVRYDESRERKRVLDRYATDKSYYFRQASSTSRLLFCPIVDFDSTSVWEGLFAIEEPCAIDVHMLAAIYKKASGECPIIREMDGPPCGKGRFGCWTCTVVRQDKAVRGLIDQGHQELKPLLRFRDWLIYRRDDTRLRCTIRRNGMEGLGPFRIEARMEILRRLRLAEYQSGIPLIREEEVQEIYSLWRKDIDSASYQEDWPSNPQLA